MPINPTKLVGVRMNHKAGSTGYVELNFDGDEPITVSIEQDQFASDAFALITPTPGSLDAGYTAETQADIDTIMASWDAGEAGITTTHKLYTRGIGTAKAVTNLLELTNSYNAADMVGTGTGLLFRQWYYDAVTPAVADAGQIACVTKDNWTVGVGESYLSFSPVVGHTLVERARLDRYRMGFYGSKAWDANEANAISTVTAGYMDGLLATVSTRSTTTGGLWLEGFRDSGTNPSIDITAWEARATLAPAIRIRTFLHDGAGANTIIADDRKLIGLLNNDLDRLYVYGDGSHEFHYDTLAHGMTSILPTTCWGAVRIVGGDLDSHPQYGGLRIIGASHGHGPAMELWALGEYTCAIHSYLDIRVAKANGAGVTGIDSGDYALRVLNDTTQIVGVYGDGALKLASIPHETTDVDAFLVSNAGLVKYRTGAELLSDIGAAPASHALDSATHTIGSLGNLQLLYGSTSGAVVQSNAAFKVDPATGLLTVGPNSGYGTTKGFLLVPTLPGGVGAYDRAYQIAPLQTAAATGNSILMYLVPTTGPGVTQPLQFGIVVNGCVNGTGSSTTSYVGLDFTALNATNNTYIYLNGNGTAAPTGNWAIYDQSGYQSVMSGPLSIGTGMAASLPNKLNVYHGNIAVCAASATTAGLLFGDMTGSYNGAYGWLDYNQNGTGIRLSAWDFSSASVIQLGGNTLAAYGAATFTPYLSVNVHTGLVSLPAYSTAGVLHNSAAGLISTSLIVAADIGAVVNTSVIPKGGPANASLVASSIADDGTTVKTALALGVGTSSTPTTAGVIRCDTGLGVGVDPTSTTIGNFEKDQNALSHIYLTNVNNHASAGSEIAVLSHTGSANYISIMSCPALGTGIGTAGWSGIRSVNTSGFVIRNTSNTDMTFKTNDTVRLTIAAAGSIDVVGALMANSLGWDNVQTVDTSAASPISVTPTSSRIEVPGKGSGMDFTIALQAGALVEGTILAVSFIGAAYDLTIDSDGADVVLDAKEGCLFIKSSIGWLPLGGAS
jgi:hypothetical protein